MKTNNLCVKASALALLVVATLFPGIVGADVKVTSGLACNTVLPAQSQRAEWREYGVVNKDEKKPLWVICPLERNAMGSDSIYSPEYFSAALAAFKLPSQPESSANVRCILKELIGANRVGALSQTVIVNSGSQGVLGVCDIEPEDWASSFIFVCELPPGTGVSALMSERHAYGAPQISVQLGLPEC